MTMIALQVITFVSTLALPDKNTVILWLPDPDVNNTIQDFLLNGAGNEKEPHR